MAVGVQASVGRRKLWEHRLGKELGKTCKCDPGLHPRNGIKNRRSHHTVQAEAGSVSFPEGLGLRLTWRSTAALAGHFPSSGHPPAVRRCRTQPPGAHPTPRASSSESAPSQPRLEAQKATLIPSGKRGCGYQMQKASSQVLGAE